MLECRHRVDLLDEALLELRVLDHLLLGQALDGVEGGRRGGLGGQQHVSETTLAYLAHAVELVGVKDVPSLQLLIALEHNLIGESKYISAGKESKSVVLLPLQSNLFRPRWIHPIRTSFYILPLREDAGEPPFLPHSPLIYGIMVNNYFY